MMNLKSGAGVQCAVVPDLVFEESSYDRTDETKERGL